jgi:hypothetical protein
VVLVSFVSARPARADVEVYNLDTPKLPKLSLSLYGWVQPRFSAQQADDRPQVNLSPKPAFTVQRARFGTVAKLGKWARAQFEIDVAREFTQALDAFVVITPIDEEWATLNLQLGQFRVPFSRQNQLSSRSFQLPDVAYFVAPKFLVDRDIGAMVSSDLFKKRAKVSAGVFNGNDPGRGQTINSDSYFLFAARAEVSPLGPAPRFEGDVRALDERKNFIFTLGGGAMRTRFEDKHFYRSYYGVDLAAWWRGASIYGEFYYHTDDPVVASGVDASARVKQIGANAQLGYFAPIPWVEEHLEIVARAEYIDPNITVKQPAPDSGSRELDGANPTWGYVGFVFGGNLFFDRGHDLKVQATYEIRNETKSCLTGQSGAQCTGLIANNLFITQVTAGF